MVAQKMSTTVVGVFDDHQAARRTVQALKNEGFTESEIGVASTGDHAQGEDLDSDDEGYSGEGALTGAVAGAGAGALWGLGILAGVLPAIGPAIAGGTLAVLLSSAAAGAAAAGLAGALIGMGLSKDEAEYYESEMKAGRTIVTVKAGNRRQEVMALIKQFGGYDIESRGSIDAEATTGRTTTAATQRRTDRSTAEDHRTQSMDRQASSSQDKTIQAREERLDVRKTPVETGNVTVRKEVKTQRKTVDIPVEREEIVIERHAGGKGTRVSSDKLAPGQEVRIPVKEEKVDIRKENVVSEEVTVGKRRVKDVEHVDENLRKEEIKVEKHGDVNVKDKRK
jgi:uncharacterized protein (TIGR02271 family)